MRDQAFAAVLDVIRGMHAPHIAAGGDAAAMLAEVDGVLAGIDRPEHEPVARTLPGARHLAAAVEAAAGGPGEAIAFALAGLAPRLRWIANPHYSDALMGEGYMANYAYCNLLGWEGFAARDSLACGFLLLGPGLHYPDHAHPAEEVYCPLTDDSEWSRDRGPFEGRSRGALIHHPSWMPHATRVGRTPLLALYFWRGELGGDRAKLV